MRKLLLAGVGLSIQLAAQGLQLPTEIVDPAQNYWFGWNNTGAYLPAGPVTFPATYGSFPSLYGAELQLSRSPAGNALTARAEGSCGASFSVTFRLKTDLVTHVAMPSPARIVIQVQNTLSYVQSLSTALPLLAYGVDLGADGQDEFFSNALQPTTTATLVTWCDDVGSPVRWHHELVGGHTLGGYLQATSELTLQFDEPTQEATYGPACAGKLGGQLGGGTYDRILVASLPGNTTFAWLMGGTQPWNVQFQGFACPLLVDPQFILAVPIFDGPDQRKYADFAATFPPLPGMNWYVQGIAVSGGTFVGTNGVRIQT